jgi:hypothetical protein
LTLFIELASTVRAGPRAIAAANTFLIVYENDAILFAFIACTCRANRNARRLFAM